MGIKSNSRNDLSILYFWKPGIQTSRNPGIPWIWLIFADYNVQGIFPAQFLSLNSIFNAKFQNSIIPGIFEVSSRTLQFKLSSFLEYSWNYLELWNSSGSGLFLTKFDKQGIFSHSIFSPKFESECRIQKLQHCRNLLS